MYFITEQLSRRNNFIASLLLRQINPTIKYKQNIRRKKDKKNDNILSTLIQPISVKTREGDGVVGVELTGALDKVKLGSILANFAKENVIKQLSKENGIDNVIFSTAISRFQVYCVESSSKLPTDLHIVLNDIMQEAGHITDIFPYFLRFTKEMYPHLDCLEELKKISDLRNPSVWYPLARCKKRRFIFHAGPTNSGKTYHALERFMKAKSGVYCGPLKLLANEVFLKCNSKGTPCDLITGEEVKYVKSIDSPADHVSCSVEMVNTQNEYEVGVIDEVQLIRDPSRGWAWTRALLGICAEEIHVCGEHAAIPIVKSICSTTGENVEIQEYTRLTTLEVENTALCSLNNLLPGDCIVCFSRKDIFDISLAIQKLGIKVAIIYGSLPPATKLSQAAIFNDKSNTCNILIATNAIGMGLNLHIRRIIFYTLYQITLNEKGEKEKDLISVSDALQIAGRAGRYGSQWNKGYVTTFRAVELPILKHLLSQKPNEIKRAGLHPTAEQIELYNFYLPETALSNLINIFIALCEFDSLYFICNLDDFKFLADMIQHIPLPIRTRYVFCCAPVNRKLALTCTMLLKYARQCSRNEPVTITWLHKQIEWTYNSNTKLNDLINLEELFDVLEIYLWLSYRMPDMFPHTTEVKDLQKLIDTKINSKLMRLKTRIDDKELSLMEESYGKETLTDTLISKGLLTRKMLQQLKLEWSMQPDTTHKKTNKRH